MTKTKQRHEIIFGAHPITEVLSAKRRPIYAVYTVQPEPKAFRIIKSRLPGKATIHHVKREVLTRMAGTSDHQNIVATVGPYPYKKQFFSPQSAPFVVMLDSIQDTRNMGGIIRSAYCAGANGVIITTKGGAPLSASAFKSSAGFAEHMDIYLCDTPQQAVQLLKKAGYSLYLAALGGTNATHISYETPLALIIGNEATGITPSILNAGTKVTLPQRTAEISYNASVAAGILIFLIATHTNRI